MSVDAARFRTRLDPAIQPCTRKLEFARADGGAATGFPLDALMKAVFAMLAPGRPLPDATVPVKGPRYNWGADEVYLRAEGDGILIAENCRGAVAGDDVETWYQMIVGDEVDMGVSLARDYFQATLVFSFSATAGAIDVATEALLQASAARGLVLVSREDVHR